VTSSLPSRLTPSSIRGTTLFAAGTTLVHIAVAVFHGGPVAVPDIPSYLQFAYGTGGQAVPSPTSYHPGYGLLLRPLTLVGINGLDLHQAALVFNALLAGLCVYLTTIFASRLRLSPRLSAMCAAIAALYPGLSAASRIAWPETLLCAAVLGSAILAHDQTPRKNLFLGLLSGLLFSVHPRAIVVTAALIVLGALMPSKQLRRPLVIGGVLGWVVSATVIFQTDTWQQTRVKAAKESTAIFEVIASGLGQLTAVAVSSVGLGLLGVLMSLATVSQVVRRKSLLDPDAASRVYLGIGFLAMVALGGVALAGSQRIDTAIYGRYIDPWVLPLIVIAIAGLKPRPTKSQLRQLTWSFAAGIVVMAFAMSNLGESPRRIMTLSTGWIWEATDQVKIFTLITVAIVVFVAVIGRTVPGKTAEILIGTLLLCSAASTVMNHTHLAEVGEIAEGQASTAVFVPDTVSCLAHDVATTKPYTPSLYQLTLPHIQHRRVDLAAGEQPCSAYLIAGFDVPDKCPNARLVAKEIRGQWGLWYNPDEECD